MTSAPATKAEFPVSVTGDRDQRWGHKGSQRDTDGEGGLLSFSAHGGPIIHSLCPPDPDPLSTGAQHLLGALWHPSEMGATAVTRLHPTDVRATSGEKVSRLPHGLLLSKAWREHLRGCKLASFLF